MIYFNILADVFLCRTHMSSFGVRIWSRYWIRHWNSSFDSTFPDSESDSVRVSDAEFVAMGFEKVTRESRGGGLWFCGRIWRRYWLTLWRSRRWVWKRDGVEGSGGDFWGVGKWE